MGIHRAVESTETGEILTKPLSPTFRDFFLLTLPLILTLSSSSLMGFCDRLFLAHYSLDALEASAAASALCNLFQHPLMRIVTMAQVFVGLYNGSKKFTQIGQTIWQMIWFSLSSLLLTLPIGLTISPYFFRGTSIEHSALTYFNTMMFFNFLFPLGAALTSYFVGLGRTKIIFLVMLYCQIVNVILDYLFIFGIEGYLAPQGIYGAALATGISQTLFCFSLLFAFVRKKERETYRTDLFSLNWKSLWEQMRVGLPRAVARIIILINWAAITRIMVLRGGQHLMVLSIGGTLILLLTFINDGMYQAMITLVSNSLGARDHYKIRKFVRMAFCFLIGMTCLLSIPYLFFPEITLSFFYKQPPSPETLALLKRMCIWLWLFFFCYGLNAIGLSLITAARDVTFYFLTISCIWLTAYIPCYFFIDVLNVSADKLWLILAIDSLTHGSIYLFRYRSRRERYALS